MAISVTTMIIEPRRLFVRRIAIEIVIQLTNRILVEWSKSFPMMIIFVIIIIVAKQMMMLIIINLT